jgi:hypothetical protein
MSAINHYSSDENSELKSEEIFDIFLGLFSADEPEDIDRVMRKTFSSHHRTPPSIDRTKRRRPGFRSFPVNQIRVISDDRSVTAQYDSAEILARSGLEFIETALKTHSITPPKMPTIAEVLHDDNPLAKIASITHLTFPTALAILAVTGLVYYKINLDK